jgi:general secretion pathway protein I
MPGRTALMSPQAGRARGFTLLETLVALAILAIALTAAFRAMGVTAQSARPTCANA